LIWGKRLKILSPKKNGRKAKTPQKKFPQKEGEETTKKTQKRGKNDTSISVEGKTGPMGKPAGRKISTFKEKKGETGLFDKTQVNDGRN